MSVVCLGWGSLVWDPRCLPILGNWHTDGPELPIEFARESGDRRITLVLTDDAILLPSLWATLAVVSLDEAKACLARREGIRDRNIRCSIGFWDKSGRSHGRSKEVIGDWASSKGLDSVVWTNLKFGFRGRLDQMPTAAEVVDHLCGLCGEARCKAEMYVRCAPCQIRTKYRAQIEKALHWYPPEARVVEGST